MVVPVLLLSRQLGSGGTARDVSNIARALDLSRYEPHIGCFDCRGLRSHELEAAQLPVTRFPVTSFRSMSFPAGILQMGRYLRRHKIKLIHAFDGPTDFFGALAGSLFLTPVITANLWHRDLVPRRYRYLQRLSDLLSSAVIVNSQAIYNHLADDEKLPSTKLHLCYGGVDTTVFKQHVSRRPPVLESADLIIGSVCVLRREKGLDLLLDAFARVRHLAARPRLLIVGSGEMLPKLRDQARHLSIEGYCIFEPETPEVSAWMRAIDVFALPSLSESLPNALLESMACGCCVVAARVGGIPEIISDGENGLLFAPGAVNELAMLLALTIRNRALRERLGGNAMRTVRECFSIETSVRRIEAIYTTVLQNSKKPPAPN